MCERMAGVLFVWSPMVASDLVAGAVRYLTVSVAGYRYTIYLRWEKISDGFLGWQRSGLGFNGGSILGRG